MMLNYLIALFSLGVLIFIHELGHFLVAKFFRVKVEMFSLGFGPKLIGFKRGDTEYKICAVPFGGFVKMKGEEPGEAKSGDPDEFGSKPIYQRALIILAGPMVNLAFGFLVFFGIYTVLGTEIQGFLPKVGSVLDYLTPAGDMQPSPAKAAGLREGDDILAIDGTPVKTFFDIQRLIRNSDGRPLAFTCGRDGQEMVVTITPRLNEKNGQYFIGFSAFEAPVIGKVIENYPAGNADIRKGDRVLAVNDVTCTQFVDVKREIFFSSRDTIDLSLQRDGRILRVSVPPLRREIPTEAIGEYTGDTLIYNGRVYIPAGTKEISIAQIGIYPENMTLRFSPLKSIRLAYDDTVFIIDKTIWTLKLLFTRKVSIKQLAGPLGIIHLTGERAAVSLEELLRIVALLTVSLWFVNLMPIPALDGGWIMFLAIESLMKKPVSPKIQGALQNVCFVLLISLIVFITYGDILRWWDERQQLSKGRNSISAVQ